MGSSGLLLVGVVALWLFGAMPHWVRRSEALAAEHVANDPFAQRAVPARRREVDDLAETTSGGILGRPRRDDGPRRSGSVLVPAPALAQPPSRAAAASSGPRAPRGAGPRRRPRRSPAPLVAVVVLVALVAAPTLLALGGASVATVVLSAAALFALGIAVLRVLARRAAVRRRALARRHAARPRLVPSAAQHPGARRSEADEDSTDRRHAVGA